MKSKTLKDWRHDLPDFIMKEIKAEAIKWVKNCKNTEDFSTHNACGFYYIKRDKTTLKPKPVFCCCCQRTMKMNNITEEDLSQGMTQEVPK